MNTFRIYRCIKSNYLVQGFGENKACGQKQPNGTIRVAIKRSDGTCPIGYLPLYTEILGMLGHNGVDRACFYGEPGYFPVEAEYNGVPVKWWMKTERDWGGGIGVDIVSDIPFLPCTEKVGTLCPPGTFHHVKWRAWHHLRVVGWDEKWIKFGELIFYGDSTGISGGNHVHESPKWCNALGEALHKDNGYQGAFSGADFRVERFVLDIIKERQEAEIRLAEEARREEEAERLRAELEEQIKASQLTLLQILYKFIFILQESIRKAAAGLGGLFK